ncbi:MAG: DUF4625 domain-containing protein [Tannerellaceae bacterium]|jgi:uncharacterized membrane protein|nr:DUF4625 domain-containing protein [Tannerellaceae bacterium]
MKTKTNYISLISLCLSAMFTLSLASCESGDTTKPVINLIEPAEGDVLEIGQDVHFEMELSDNDLLREYKVEIHNNFDNHSHEATRAEETLVPFYFEQTWNDISGKKNAQVHHHDIVIPANAEPGDYHLEVFCTDASGNEAYLVRNIELSYEGGDHDHDHDED